MAYTDQAKKKAYFRAYYQRNKEKYRERSAAQRKLQPQILKASQARYLEANRDQLNAKHRERYRTDPEYRRRHQDRNRAARLRKLGLTPEDWRDILDEQGGGCAICGRSPRVTKMVVDHDHKTGLVRGLLCGSCNKGLGMFRDRPDLVAEAADYLTRSSSGATSIPSNVPSSWPYTTVAYRIRRSMDPSVWRSESDA